MTAPDEETMTEAQKIYSAFPMNFNAFWKALHVPEEHARTHTREELDAYDLLQKAKAVQHDHGELIIFTFPEDGSRLEIAQWGCRCFEKKN